MAAVPKVQRAGGNAQLVIAALAVLALGIGLRVVALGKEGFWEDEIFSASFAGLSALGTVFSVLLLDVHPPLYYVQLHAWGLLGHRDFWLLLNSVFWSAGTMVAVFYGASRSFGVRAGLLAMLFCAVIGGEIFFARELRMYSMCGCLSVLSWIAADRYRGVYSFRAAVPLILLLAMTGAIHGASTIPVSAALIYASPIMRGSWERHRAMNWIAVCAIAACALLPWIVNARLHHIDHTRPASWSAAIHTVAGWLLGYGSVAIPSWLTGLVAIALAGALGATLLLRPATAGLVGCFVVWPLLFGALLSAVVQPIWLDRTFAFCAPFVAIALGVGADVALGRHMVPPNANLRSRAAGGLIVMLVVALSGLAYLQATTPNKPDQFRELARYLSVRAQPDEIIYAPESVVFWGVSRYLIGPDWGSILKVQDPQEIERLKKWRFISRLVGRDALDRAGLAPVSPRLDGFRIPEFTGFSPPQARHAIRGVWLVAFDATAVGGLWHCDGEMSMPTKFGRLRLYYVQCPLSAL